MSLFIPITKVDVARRLVYGTISEEIPDKSGEILDYESAKPAFMEWSDQFREASGGKSLGNVRAMHGAVAAGKLTDIAYDDANKRIEGVAKVVDDDEWQKVLEGVYTGFSIGGGYARRWPDAMNPELMRYTPTLSEVSLVDNPAVPTATFQVVKDDGSVELRKFNPSQEIPVNKAAAPAPQDDSHARIDDLLEQLSWLENKMQDDGDDDILSHIHALQDYLSGEEGEAEPDDDDTSAHAYAGELARLAGNTTFVQENKMEKRYLRMSSALEALQKRITHLEAQPVPARGVMRIVTKSEDRRGGEEVLAQLTPAERARELMKIALANPVEI